MSNQQNAILLKAQTILDRFGYSDASQYLKSHGFTPDQIVEAIGKEPMNHE